MIQCVSEGKSIFLVKHENLFSELSDGIVEAANYRIRRKHSDVLNDISENVERVKFPEVRKEIPFDRLDDKIFSIKKGLPLEFKGKDITTIKEEASVIRNELSKTYFSTKKSEDYDELRVKLKKYCDFLEKNNTTDCVIMSLKNVRVLSEDYVRYDFKDIMDEISDKINKYQHQTKCLKFLKSFIQREKHILEDMKRSFMMSKLVEFMFALTDKLTFSMEMSPKSSSMSSWKENMKSLSFVLYEDIHTIKFKIDNVRSVEEAQTMCIFLAGLPRKKHTQMDLDKIGYDFDFVLHLGSDEKFITLESLVPNSIILDQIKKEIHEKKVYVITHNVNAHEEGFLDAFLSKFIGDDYEKITILSTRNGKSEKILENGISTFYDDKEEVLREINQNVKMIKGFENFKLFKVTEGFPSVYSVEVKPFAWFVPFDERVSVSAPWYTAGENFSNDEPCNGCASKSKNYSDHTFDKFCKVTCKACKYRRHDQHSTYTRQFCLPGVRNAINKTILPDWSYFNVLKMLDDKNATFKIVDNYMKIFGDCDCFVAKYVLCSSPIRVVQIYNEGQVKVYCANTISTSLSIVTDAQSIRRAIANCKIRECKKYPEF